jgi:CheY-like chemotaxis protein
MNEKILIIDDNKDFADAIRTILETKQYDVKIATSSDEALKKLDEEIPDLVILDIIMQKGAEGILLARRFKKDPKLNKIPILMLTSITQQTGFKFVEDDPRHPKFLPVELFVEKPVSPDELLEKVKNLLSSKEK